MDRYIRKMLAALAGARTVLFKSLRFVQPEFARNTNC
jgi:hypothetical protein